MNDDPSGREARHPADRPTDTMERLRAEQAASEVGQQLRQALRLAGTAQALLASPGGVSLPRMIMEHAAHVTGARSASLFRLDEAADVLIIEYALGPKSAEVLHLQVPLGHGVVGLAAASGQALAVSNARHDPRHAVEIADRVGYWPDSIACAPLLLDDRVVGVLELLDKEGAPSFSAADLELLGLFANQAALALAQERARHSLYHFLADALAPLTDPTSPESNVAAEQMRAVAAAVERDPLYRQGLEVADLIQTIASRGEHELAACREILRTFARYLETTRPGFRAASPGLGTGDQELGTLF